MYPWASYLYNRSVSQLLHSQECCKHKDSTVCSVVLVMGPYKHLRYLNMIVGHKLKSVDLILELNFWGFDSTQKKGKGIQL